MDGIMVLALLGLAVWKWHFAPRQKIRDAKADAEALEIRAEAESKVAIMRAQTDIEITDIYRRAAMDSDKKEY